MSRLFVPWSYRHSSFMYCSVTDSQIENIVGIFPHVLTPSFLGDLEIMQNISLLIMILLEVWRLRKVKSDS